MGGGGRAVRWLEGRGGGPAPGRTVWGYRQYDERGVQRLRFIRRGGSLGLPLQQLKTLITTMDGEPRPALRPRLLTLARDQLSAVKQHIAELQLLQRELEQVLQRPLASLRERRAKGCQCLEVQSARGRRQRTSAPS